MNLFEKKYVPKKINEIIGNKEAIDDIVLWLRNFKKNKCSCLLITGGHSVGKTMIINIILNELNYDIQQVNFYKIKKGIDDLSETINSCYNIISYINKKKPMILIDDLDLITSITEKTYIINLIKKNEKMHQIPIILIAGNSHNKLIGQIKKNMDEIKILKPCIKDILILMEKIIKTEKMKIDKDTIYKIIEHSKCIFNRIIFILADLKNIYKNKEITLEDFNNYNNTFIDSTIDFELYDVSYDLLTTQNDIETIIKKFMTNKVLIPLMIQQNYAKYIMKFEKNCDKQKEILKNISDSLSTGDIIENNIYSEQSWDLISLYGFYSCVIPAYNITTINKDKIRIELKFPDDLPKTSSKKINANNLKYIFNHFDNITIFDLLMIKNIIKKDNIILKDYKLTTNDINLISKIDKLK
jgi:hypothetical protein